MSTAPTFDESVWKSNPLKLLAQALFNEVIKYRRYEGRILLDTASNGDGSALIEYSNLHTWPFTEGDVRSAWNRLITSPNALKYYGFSDHSVGLYAIDNEVFADRRLLDMVNGCSIID